MSYINQKPLSERFGYVDPMEPRPAFNVEPIQVTCRTVDLAPPAPRIVERPCQLPSIAPVAQPSIREARELSYGLLSDHV